MKNSIDINYYLSPEFNKEGAFDDVIKEWLGKNSLGPLKMGGLTERVDCCLFMAGDGTTHQVEVSNRLEGSNEYYRRVVRVSSSSKFSLSPRGLFEALAYQNYEKIPENHELAKIFRQDNS